MNCRVGNSNGWRLHGQIVTDPSLIVADEPTGDLDRQAASEVLLMLNRLNRELGTTIIMVTHDAHAAEQARSTIHLDKGELRPATLNAASMPASATPAPGPH